MAAEQPRKGHRKSRHGCICCKRRKVKCDEAKPSCTNCAHFNIPCQYVSVGEGGRAVGAQVPPQLPVSSARGRGRPRRDWAASLWPADYVDTKRSPREPTPVPAPLGETPPNLAHVELLHHFVVHTGPSLAGTDRQDDLIALFWSRNAPRIGLSTHAVLYLTFALAAYHLVYLGTEDVESQERYLSLAQYYNYIGLSELNKEFLKLGETNCGSVYVAAMLLCFNAFAAGPSSPEDLLICDAGDDTLSKCSYLASGVRFIRMSFTASALFTGLTKPLADSEEEPEDDRPTCEREHFPRVDWASPLNELRAFVASSPQATEHTAVYISALDEVITYYEAAYGDENRTYTGPKAYRFVLRWLYVMQDPFVQRVGNLEPMALLVLAYYVPLLKTMRKAWFMSRWTLHLLSSIRNLLVTDFAAWLEWPSMVAESIKFGTPSA